MPVIPVMGKGVGNGRVGAGLNEYIGPFGERPKCAESLFCLEVEHDGAFTAIRRKKQGAVAAPEGWTPITGGIATGGFYLDNVGSEVGQDLSAKGTGQVLRQIKDP